MPKKPHNASTITPSDTYSIAVDPANSDLRVGGFVSFLVTGNQPNDGSSGLSIKIVATLANGAQPIITAGTADKTLPLTSLAEPAPCVASLYIPSPGNQTPLATCTFDVTA